MSSFSKWYLSTRKQRTGVFKFIQFLPRFQKAPISWVWWIKVTQSALGPGHLFSHFDKKFIPTWNQSSSRNPLFAVLCFIFNRLLKNLFLSVRLLILWYHFYHICLKPVFIASPLYVSKSACEMVSNARAPADGVPLKKRTKSLNGEINLRFQIPPT